MPCTLYIPHLLLPRTRGAAVWRTAQAPHLKLLLARARYTRDAETDATAALCALFGIARQHDYPLAPLLAHAHSLEVRDSYWLRAAPVHLETRRHALVLADPAALQVSDAESAALAATLSSHLAQENIALHAPRPGLWLVRSDEVPAMTTHHLDAAVGQDVRGFLPQGAGSRRWHRLLTEMQMLLHTHPVNAAREARGELPLNSVWLWAGGTLPPRSVAAYTKVWSDDPLVRALAQHAQGTCPTAPAPIRITADMLNEGTHFVAADPLAASALDGGHNDWQAWSAALSALDRNWFAPLLQALRMRRGHRVTLLTSDPGGTHRFVATAWDLLKFWRQNNYLA